MRTAEKSGDYISRFRRQPVWPRSIQPAEVVPPAAAAQPVASPFCVVLCPLRGSLVGGIVTSVGPQGNAANVRRIGVRADWD